MFLPFVCGGGFCVYSLLCYLLSCYAIILTRRETDWFTLKRYCLLILCDCKWSVLSHSVMSWSAVCECGFFFDDAHLMELCIKPIEMLNMPLGISYNTKWNFTGLCGSGESYIVFY